MDEPFQFDLNEFLRIASGDIPSPQSPPASPPPPESPVSPPPPPAAAPARLPTIVDALLDAASGRPDPALQERVQGLQQARERASRMDESTFAKVISAIPGVATGYDWGNAYQYGAALRRVQEGRPQEGDYDKIAAHERLRTIEQERTTGESIARELPRLGATLGEAIAGGQMFRGAQAATTAGQGILRTAAGFLGRTAAQQATMPSMWNVSQGIEQNLQNDRNPLDPRGIGAAAAQGFVATAVLGRLNSWAGGVTGSSVGRAALRTGIRTVTGTGEQQAADVALSAADDLAKVVVGRSMGLDTGYGTLGSFIRGDDDRWKRLTHQVLAFAVFGASHEVHGRDPVMDRFIDATRDLRRNGATKEQAASVLDQMHEAVANPDVSREQARATFDGLPEGPLRDYGMAIADTRPEAAQPRPEQPTEQPAPESGQARPQEPAQAPLERPATEPAPIDPREQRAADQALSLEIARTGRFPAELADTPLAATYERAVEAGYPRNFQTLERARFVDAARQAAPEHADVIFDQQFPKRQAAPGGPERPATEQPAEVPSERRPDAVAGQPEAPAATPETVRPATEQASIPKSEQPNAQPVRDRLAGMRRRQQEVNAAPRPSESVIRAEPAPPRPEAPAEPVAPVLDAREQHILDQRALARSLESIGADPEVRGEGKPLSKEGVRKIEQKARAKLGETTSMAQVHAKEKLARAAEMVAKGEKVDASDLHADPEKTIQYFDEYSKAEARYVAAVNRLLNQHAREVAKGKLSPERTAFYESEYRRLDEQRTREQQGKVGKAPGVPAELPGERPAEGPPAERRGETPAVAGQREAVPGGAGEAAPGQAGGRNLTSTARMQRGRAVPKEFAARLTEAGYGPDAIEELHQRAKVLREEDRTTTDARNELVRRAMAELQNRTEALTGQRLRDKFKRDLTSLREERFDDPSKIPGFDEVVDSLTGSGTGTMRQKGDNLLSQFARQGVTDPEQILFDMLKEGPRRPRSEREIYLDAFDQVSAEPPPLNSKDVADANRELARFGEKPLAKKDIDAAAEEGRRDGIREVAQELGDSYEGDTPAHDISFDPAEFDAPAKPAALSREDQASADFFAPREEQGKLDLRTSEAPQTLAQAQAEIDARTKPTTIEQAWAEKNRPKEEPSPLLDRPFGAPLTEAEKRSGMAGGGQSGEGATRAPLQETALANARIDAERAQRGLPPIMSEARKANPEVWDAAMAQRLRDPGSADRLIAELINKPRATTVEENALLLQHKIALANERSRAIKELLRLYRDKTSSDVDIAQAEARETQFGNEQDMLDKVIRRSGTEWGRAGQFRRQLAREDFTLSSMLGQAEAAKGRPLTIEEKSKIEEMASKIAELQKKLDAAEKRGEVKPGEPSDTGFQIDQIQRKFRTQIKTDVEARKPLLHHIGRELGGAATAPRSLMAMIDFALGRQGWVAALTHPVRTAQAIPEMLRAFSSETAAERSNYEIRHRRNAELYDRYGLDITSREQSPAGREEDFRNSGMIGRLIERIPGVKASERAYSTLLNRLRADSFDVMAANLSRGGRLSDAEGRILAHYSNVMTGRGSLGNAERSATWLSQVFFAPKWVMSRLQMVSGQPLVTRAGGELAPRARLEVAKEYARLAVGLGAVIGVAKMAGFDVETDPRSSNFGKLKIGNTRVDLTGGMATAATFLSRATTGVTRTSDGRRPFSADDLGRFVRGKLAPLPSAVTNWVTGKDMGRQPVTVAGEAKKLVVPLYLRDVYDAMKDLGVPGGTAVAILGLFGAGINTYENSPRR